MFDYRSDHEQHNIKVFFALGKTTFIFQVVLNATLQDPCMFLHLVPIWTSLRVCVHIICHGMKWRSKQLPCSMSPFKAQRSPIIGPVPPIKDETERM